MKFATIDIGTNSVRLCIGLEEGGQIKPILAKLTITRLGQGVDKTKQLSLAAMRRTSAIVQHYCQVAREHEPDTLFVLATSAVRDALNRDQFIAMIKEQTGEALRILSGREEAQASFLGAILALQSRLSDNQKLLVLDIGGGSTELLYGTSDGEVLSGESVQVGSVRMTEAFISAHPVPLKEQNGMIKEIRARLTPLIEQCRYVEPVTLVGVGGTVTTLAALDCKLSSYDPKKITGFRMGIERVRFWFDELVSMDLNLRLQVPGMSAGREDVIVAGVSILKEVMDMLAIKEIVVSDGDLLQGVLYLEKNWC